MHYNTDAIKHVKLKMMSQTAIAALHNYELSDLKMTKNFLNETLFTLHKDVAFFFSL